GGPCAERERVRVRTERGWVEAVGRDAGDRDDEEDDEPGERQAEEAGSHQVRPSMPPRPSPLRWNLGLGLDGHSSLARVRYDALTCSHAFSYCARRGMSRSRCAFGSVTAFGLFSCRARSRSLELGRASVFAWP